MEIPVGILRRRDSDHIPVVDVQRVDRYISGVGSYGCRVRNRVHENGDIINIDGNGHTVGRESHFNPGLDLEFPPVGPPVEGV